MDEYKFALVGCSRIAKRHAELLSGVVSGAKLVAVCDVDADKARAFGEKYGVDWYQNMDEMVSRAQPDVVSVLTPSGMHRDHVLQLAPYGKRQLKVWVPEYLQDSRSA